jgi:hypothetical protein
MEIAKIIITNQKQSIQPAQIKFTSRINKQSIDMVQDTFTYVAKPIAKAIEVNSSKEKQGAVEKLVILIKQFLNNPQPSSKDSDELYQVIQEALPEIQKEENLLGMGVFNKVYRINDDFAAKFYLGKNTQLTPFYNKKVFEKSNNEYSDLLTYMGDVILDTGKFRILRNLGEHIPAGKPHNLTEQPGVYYIKKYLPAFSKVPQESYDAILEDCGRLNDRYEKMGCYKLFDFLNSNNIVLKGDKLYWVDEIQESEKDWNTITKVLSMMLNHRYIRDKEITEMHGTALDNARIIFKKILHAGMKADVPIFRDIHKANDIWHNLLTNLKIDLTPSKIIEDLEKIYKIDDCKTRVQEVDKYVDSLFLK